MYKNLEKKLNYKFKDINILEQAFFHTSLVNERKMDAIASNERLEFLGDAVLQIVVSELLYKKYPKMLEGDLSKLRASLVCEQAFAENARELSLEKYIKMSKGETSAKGYERESTLADAFEAVIGAIFLDSSIEEVKPIIVSIIEPKITKDKASLKNWDYKTKLQEIIQSYSKTPLVYKIINEEGPDHAKTFVAEVSHNDEFLGKGIGRTKKEAEQNAAKEAIDKVSK